MNHIFTSWNEAPYNAKLCAYGYTMLFLWQLAYLINTVIAYPQKEETILITFFILTILLAYLGCFLIQPQLLARFNFITAVTLCTLLIAQNLITN